MNIKDLFRTINDTAAEMGLEVYVVGGYVRDKLLGHTGKDIDFVVLGDAMLFADALGKKWGLKNIVRYPRFGTFMTRYKDYHLEFVNARSESYDFESRNPVTELADLQTEAVGGGNAAATGANGHNLK